MGGTGMSIRLSGYTQSKGGDEVTCIKLLTPIIVPDWVRWPASWTESGTISGGGPCSNCAPDCSCVLSDDSFPWWECRRQPSWCRSWSWSMPSLLCPSQSCVDDSLRCFARWVVTNSASCLDSIMTPHSRSLQNNIDNIHWNMINGRVSVESRNIRSKWGISNPVSQCSLRHIDIRTVVPVWIGSNVNGVSSVASAPFSHRYYRMMVMMAMMAMNHVMMMVVRCYSVPRSLGLWHRQPLIGPPNQRQWENHRRMGCLLTPDWARWLQQVQRKRIEDVTDYCPAASYCENRSGSVAPSWCCWCNWWGGQLSYCYGIVGTWERGSVKALGFFCCLINEPSSQ